MGLRPPTRASAGFRCTRSRAGFPGGRALPTVARLITMPRARGPQVMRIVVARDPGGAIPPNTSSRVGDAVQPLFDAVSPNVARSDQEVVELALLLPLCRRWSWK